MFCDIGHDLTDAAVVFFILTGWKSCLGDRIFIQDFPKVLQSGDDLKFIHGFPATVQVDDVTDIFYGLGMPFTG